MRYNPTPRGRLAVEPLEDRSTPAVGVPWLDSTSLTLSFVPDGTDVSGTPSSLTSYFGTTPAGVWQKEILRAYQTWAASANINIGLVADGGQSLGIAGAPQEDPRFGDLRIGARPLSNGFDDSLAGAVPFAYAGGTWAGDVMLNTKFHTGIGQANGQYDLFTVMLQEAGNSLGMLDNPLDTAAVMYPWYKGAATGLGTSDVADIQALYGARKADKYEGTGNGTFAAAFNMTASGNTTALTGDVTQAGDVDVYKFTTPSSGASNLSVRIQAEGLSLFTGRVTVYDAGENVVGTAVATDPRANDLVVPVANYRASSTYFVKVEGAANDVFSIGAYNLELDYNASVGKSAIATFEPYINYEGWWSNSTRLSAEVLAPLSKGHASTFAVGGLLTDALDMDWFKFTPSVDASGTLTVSVWAFNGSAVVPTVSVYDSAGALVPTEVITNDHGLFTIQATDRVAGESYYARVSAVKSGTSATTGLYVLGADLGQHAPTLYDALTGGTLTAANSVTYSTMTVGEARLTQFALSATTAGSTAAVRMTVFDSQGNRVFTLVAETGKPLTTGVVWLPSGTYTVAYNAATKSGASLTSLAFSLWKWERSGPIDPFPIDPLLPPPPPPPGGQVVTTPPDPILPIGPIGPISDPFWFI